MDTVITCPNCKTEIPLSDAFKNEIEAGVLATERARHQRELEAAVKAAETPPQKKQPMKPPTAKHRCAPKLPRRRSAPQLLNQLEEMTTELRALRRKDEERELRLTSSSSAAPRKAAHSAPRTRARTPTTSTR